MRSDVQVGGTDQLFNIVTAARKVYDLYGRETKHRRHSGYPPPAPMAKSR